MTRSSAEWGNGRECEVTRLISKLIERGFQWTSGEMLKAYFGLRLPDIDLKVVLAHKSEYGLLVFSTDGSHPRVSSQYREEGELLKDIDRYICESVVSLQSGGRES